MPEKMAFISGLPCPFNANYSTMKKIIAIPLMLMTLITMAAAQHNASSIIGRWMNADNNLEVEIFKVGDEYRARVVWFDDTDDKSNPMYQRCDKKNPDKGLRNRKLIGLEVMHGLVYNSGEDEWQEGKIYDASSGKDWNAKAWLTEDGCLKVRGFWHLEFLGQNICFKRVQLNLLKP